MFKDKTDEYDSRLDRPKLKYPDGNPKTQFGITKPRETYCPTIPQLEYALAHLQGALKYGPFNWRDDPVTMSTYLDAAISHIKLFKEGQDRASDTDIHHLGHAMTCLSIIIDAQHYGSMIDDRWRPRDPNGPNAGDILDKYMEDTQSRVRAIREKWTGFAETQRAKKVGELVGMLVQITKGQFAGEKGVVTEDAGSVIRIRLQDVPKEHPGSYWNRDAFEVLEKHVPKDLGRA